MGIHKYLSHTTATALHRPGAELGLIRGAAEISAFVLPGRGSICCDGGADTNICNDNGDNTAAGNE